ncbi:MAG: SRPBCC family protein [Solirubrobacterales bacterium]|nr:SRPBCC family protein [Solirubrobacterales bacterium]
MQRLIFDHDYTQPPEQVFAYLSEHENLADVFGAKITRLNDGTDGNRNGVGSARELKVGPAPPFEETVTEFVPNELIVYEVTKGSPIKDHRGEMRFTAEGTGTHLHYEISFTGKLPGLGPIIAQGLKRNVAKGLANLGPNID